MLVGLVAGFLSGLFGVGGGILIVPSLVLLLGFAQRLAHGTSLAAVLPIAIASLTSYSLEDKVDWKVGGLLAVGAVVGAVIGTHILHRLPHDTLAVAFAVLLVATAVRLLVDHSDAGGRGDLHPATVVDADRRRVDHRRTRRAARRRRRNLRRAGDGGRISASPPRSRRARPWR